MHRTLIVEDDRQVADVTRGFVDRHPLFSVVGIAGTASGAVGAIASLGVELVLLDMQLPDGIGLDVLRAVRARGYPGEVVALTAARDVETVREARRLGVRHYLVKPFSMKTLHERMDEVAATLRRDTDSGELDQGSVDALMTGNIPIRTERESKTLTLVSEALERRVEGASAGAIGEELGLSRVSARRHLERLVADGRAAVAPVYGKTGRPEMVYRDIQVG